jgi:hypothetical protein
MAAQRWRGSDSNCGLSFWMGALQGALANCILSDASLAASLASVALDCRTLLRLRVAHCALVLAAAQTVRERPSIHSALRV